MKAQLIPDDPYYSSSGSWGQNYQDLYGLHLLNTSDAWDVTTGSEDIVVAVIDTGVDYAHNDINENMWINDDEILDIARDLGIHMVGVSYVKGHEEVEEIKEKVGFHLNRRWNCKCR